MVQRGLAYSSKPNQALTVEDVTLHSLQTCVGKLLDQTSPPDLPDDAEEKYWQFIHPNF